MIIIKINNKPMTFRYKRALHDVKQLMEAFGRILFGFMAIVLAMVLFAFGFLFLITL